MFYIAFMEKHHIFRFYVVILSLRVVGFRRRKLTETVSKMFSPMMRLRPRLLEWAWDGLVPMGKLTLITGDPGVGKSLVSLQVAAMVTRGVTTPQELPGGADRLAGIASKVVTPAGAKPKQAAGRGVLIFSGADQIEDTVLPRLIAAGADASQVFFFKGYMVDELVDDYETKRNSDEGHPAARPFLLSRDLGQLDWCLEELSDEGIDVGLIVIDSIDRYIGTNEKKSDRIEVVAKLADLATRSGAAVLVTTNTSMKAGSRGGTVVYQELLNTARSVLMVAEDLERPDRRLVLPVKHNLTARPQGFSFSVEQGVVRWGTEFFDCAVGDLHQSRWNPKQPLRRDNVYELDRAVSWLNDELQDGPVSAESIQQNAAQVDISYGTLRRAAKALDCKMRKQKSHWFWSLPDRAEPVSDHQGQVEDNVEKRTGTAARQETSPISGDTTDWVEVPDSRDECDAFMREKVLIS